MPNEDTLRERIDAANTHDDPHSPFYDGPMVGEDCCEHGIPYDQTCLKCEENS